MEDPSDDTQDSGDDGNEAHHEPTPPSAATERVADLLADAERVLVITGAGVSAESGIPTFRDRGGWWRERDPTKLATREAFERDPATVWEWYGYRRSLLAQAEPNPAHHALATLERKVPELLLATQNVDALHERAGSANVVHVHGSIWHLRCVACGREEEDRRVPLPDDPRCPDCGARLRPAVVWFGEQLPSGPIHRVESHLDAGPIDVTLVVGTEAIFGYIRSWALRARASGSVLVEVNPGRTALSEAADLRLVGPAGRILPRLT